MRRTIFILLALLLVMTTCGQTVGNEGQDVTQGTIRVKMETTLGNIVVRLLERPELGGWTEEQQNIYAKVGGSPHLDGQYTVFGEVEEGLDIVEKIQNTPTGPGDRPLTNIEVKMTIIE